MVEEFTALLLCISIHFHTILTMLDLRKLLENPEIYPPYYFNEELLKIKGD